jgi:hypothetical protein
MRKPSRLAAMVSSMTETSPLPQLPDRLSTRLTGKVEPYLEK